MRGSWSEFSAVVMQGAHAWACVRCCGATSQVNLPTECIEQILNQNDAFIQEWMDVLQGVLLFVIRVHCL